MASPNTPARYPHLDALRGWAILGVLVTHTALYAGNKFPGAPLTAAGRYGVQLFFVVSAFTIFLTLDRARERGAVDWTGFFIRRFFRVLPMFWVGLALYIFAPGNMVPAAQHPHTPLDYAITALLLHGWSMGLVNTLVPGGWSIAAEGTFYLVVPLCYRFVRSWQAAVWMLVGSLALSSYALAWLKAAHASGSVGAGYSTEDAMTLAYCWFPTQFPVFVCGMLAYYLGKTRPTGGIDRPTGAALLAVAVVALHTAFQFGKHGWLLEPMCFALAYVPLVLGLQAWPARLFVNPFMQFLGRINYSFYLLHFAVLFFAMDTLEVFLPPPWQHGLTAFGLLTAATLAGTAGLAWMTYRWVELPCIDLGGRLVRWLAAMREGPRATMANKPVAAGL